MCSDKSAPLYKSSICELIRSLQNKSSIRAALEIILFCVLIFFAFTIFEQDSHFLAYIPSGKFFTIADILLPFIAIAIFFLIHKNEYPLQDRYGDIHWIHRQPLKLRKFLRVTTEIILVIIVVIASYYYIGIIASMFPIKYQQKSYVVTIKSKYVRYKGGCWYRLRTNLLNRLSAQNKSSIMLEIQKNLGLFRLCVDEKSYKSVKVGNRVELLGRESDTWGIYIDKLKNVK